MASETQVITKFSELLELLSGLRYKLVEASLFLPQDEDGYPVSSLFGTVRELTERSLGRWELSWQIEASTNPESSITLWKDRFLLAELSFTGEDDDRIDETAEPRGHNAFVKIRSEGFIIDLVVYI